MNRTPDVEFVLREYFADDGLTAPDYVLDVVAGRISRQRQRRSWPFPLPRRTVTMTPTFKLAAAVAAVAVVAVVGWQLLPDVLGPGTPVATPSAAATQPNTPAPTTPSGFLPLDEGPLAPGSYETAQGSVTVQLTLPADARGWEGGDGSFLGVPPMVDAPDGVLLAFNTVSTVMRDACTDQGPAVVGPTTADLAAVWAALPHVTVEGPSDVDLGGFPAVHVGLEVDDDLSECQVESIGIYYLGTTARVVGAGQHVDLWAVDVEGTRLVVEASYFPGATPDEIRALGRIVESIRLEATP